MDANLLQAESTPNCKVMQDLQLLLLNNGLATPVGSQAHSSESDLACCMTASALLARFVIHAMHKHGMTFETTMLIC